MKSSALQANSTVRWHPVSCVTHSTDKSVVVFRSPDATDDDVEGLERLVEQAGGTVTGTVALTPEFVNANSAEKLLSVVNSPIVPAGKQLSTMSVDQGTQAGDLLGITLLINRDPKVSVVDDAQRETVLSTLRDTGFITYGNQRIGPANTALIVTGGALGDDAGNQGASVARLAAGMAPHGSGTVLVGRDGSASGSAAVAVARSDAGPEHRLQHRRRHRFGIRPAHLGAGPRQPHRRREARSVRHRPGRRIGNRPAITIRRRVSDGLSVSVLGWGSVGRQAPATDSEPLPRRHGGCSCQRYASTRKPPPSTSSSRAASFPPSGRVSPHPASGSC